MSSNYNSDCKCNPCTCDPCNCTSTSTSNTKTNECKCNPCNCDPCNCTSNSNGNTNGCCFTYTRGKCHPIHKYGIPLLIGSLLVIGTYLFTKHCDYACKNNKNEKN